LKKTGFGFATVPCNTFFTGEEFVLAIEETREKELIQQVTPTVHGYLTTMLNGNYNIFF
jgi:hypothetical protein